MRSVNFQNPSSPDAQDYAIQRAQALAQALQQQAFKPIENSDAPLSWTQGLQKILEGYLSGKQAGQVKKLLNTKEQGIQGDIQSKINDLAPRAPTTLDSVGGEAPTQLASGLTQANAVPGGPMVPAYSDNGKQLASALQGLPSESALAALSSRQLDRAFPAPKGLIGIPEGGLYNQDTGQVQVPGQGKQFEPDRTLVKIVDKTKPEGYSTIQRSKFDPTTMNEWTAPVQDRNQVVPDVDANGKPILKLIDTTQGGRTVNPRVGTPSSTSGDARSQNMNDRVFVATNEAAIDVHNLSLMPLDVSSGLQGVGSSPGHSIFSIASDALKTTLSGEDVQSYNKVVAGLAQNIATAEAGGLATNMSRVKSFDGLLLRPGDTPLSKLQSMAGLRQNIEKVVEVKLRNPRVPQEQKDLLKQIVESVQQDVPFTVEDVIKLQAKNHPGRATLSGTARDLGLGTSDVRSQADAILNGH